MVAINEEALLAHREIDLRGESCPYPLMYTLDALAEMSTGEVLRVITDCPSSFRNIPMEARRRRFEMPVRPQKTGAEYVFHIRA